jgi:hypothetical protein
MERKIRVEVPLVLTGESAGVKSKGGILEQPLRQLFVECLPLNIPDRIAVDVASLDIGDAIHVRDLTVGEGVRILEDAARVVASVVAPAAEEVAAPVEEKPVEPEVVGKKEKVEAEAEPEADQAGGQDQTVDRWGDSGRAGWWWAWESRPGVRRDRHNVDSPWWNGWPTRRRPLGAGRFGARAAEVSFGDPVTLLKPRTSNLSGRPWPPDSGGWGCRRRDWL